MLTPIEIQNTILKGGMGYNKKETDAFLGTILRDYEQLYKENVELKDKLSVLSEGIQYYKNMETTLQKALVLAEKTSEQTQANALKNALSIEKEADAKAKLMLADAKNELSHIQTQISTLLLEFDKYKAQFKGLATSQLDLLESEVFQLRPTEPEYIERTKLVTVSEPAVTVIEPVVAAIEPVEAVIEPVVAVSDSNDSNETNFINLEEEPVVVQPIQEEFDATEKMDEFEFLDN